MQENNTSHEHHSAPEGHQSGMDHHAAAHSADSMKFKFSLSDIDWKAEVMDAIEVLKMNKTKIHEVSMREKATSVGIVFIVVPQILAAILTYITYSRLFGASGWQFFVASGLVGIISPFLFIYAIHFIGNKFFQGKGQLLPYFRVVSYVNVVSILTPVILLLALVAPAIGGLAGLVALAVAIWALVISYKLLMEMYKMTSTNTILTIIIAAVAVGIVTSIINGIFLPKTDQLVDEAFKNALKDIKY